MWRIGCKHVLLNKRDPQPRPQYRNEDPCTTTHITGSFACPCIILATSAAITQSCTAWWPAHTHLGHYRKAGKQHDGGAGTSHRTQLVQHPEAQRCHWPTAIVSSHHGQHLQHLQHTRQQYIGSTTLRTHTAAALADLGPASASHNTPQHARTRWPSLAAAVAPALPATPIKYLSQATAITHIKG